MQRFVELIEGIEDGLDGAMVSQSGLKFGHRIELLGASVFACAQSMVWQIIPDICVVTGPCARCSLRVAGQNVGCKVDVCLLDSRSLNNSAHHAGPVVAPGVLRVCRMRGAAFGPRHAWRRWGLVEPLLGYFMHQGGYLCEKDYAAATCPPCTSCGTPIAAGKLVAVAGLQLHERCFACKTCQVRVAHCARRRNAAQKPLTSLAKGEFSVQGRELFCLACSKTVLGSQCARCQQAMPTTRACIDTSSRALMAGRGGCSAGRCGPVPCRVLHVCDMRRGVWQGRQAGPVPAQRRPPLLPARKSVI